MITMKSVTDTLYFKSPSRQANGSLKDKQMGHFIFLSMGLVHRIHITFIKSDH